jgi:hypothetical protein
MEAAQWAPPEAALGVFAEAIASTFDWVLIG